MPPPPPSLPHLRTLLTTFTTTPPLLSILSTHPPSPLPPPPKTLYILDSSFNPPTLAHLSLCTTALHHDPRAQPGPKRLLLLLAINNADKAPQPAPLEQRLAMMGVFAREVVARMPVGKAEDVSVDVGVTKEPCFHGKARVVEESARYADPVSGAAPEQVLLVGFDTLTRLLDPSYYPPSYTLAPLAPLFARHRVRVTLRVGYGERAEQEAYLGALARGEREGEGGRREWAGRIEGVEGVEGVSSSGVREGVRGGGKGWRGMVTGGVVGWIEGEGLYRG